MRFYFWSCVQATWHTLGPSDAIWRYRAGPTLANVIACCLTAPSHHMNQCWLPGTKVQRHWSDGNLARDFPSNEWTHRCSVVTSYGVSERRHYQLKYSHEIFANAHIFGRENTIENVNLVINATAFIFFCQMHFVNMSVSVIYVAKFDFIFSFKTNYLCDEIKYMQAL